jgi:hypothetical protein
MNKNQGGETMKITEMNEGEKIGYELKKYKLTFNDELTVNLDKYQRDYDVTKDIMADSEGSLVIGNGRFYVAQIVIPAAEYEENVETEEKTVTDTESGEKKTENVETVTRTKKPLDTNDVELKLFSIEGIIIE